MKKIVIYLLCFLIIFLLVVFFYFLSLKIKENRIESIIKEYEIKDEYSSEALDTEENTIDYYNSKVIFFEENNITEYNKKQLEKINLDIKDIPDEVLGYIPNFDDVYNKIKEYMYFNGLVDSTEMFYEKYQIREATNQIALLFKFNNYIGTELIVIINKKTNQIEVSER